MARFEGAARALPRRANKAPAELNHQARNTIIEIRLGDAAGAEGHA